MNGRQKAESVEDDNKEGGRGAEEWAKVGTGRLGS